MQQHHNETARFIVQSDPQNDTIVFPMPKEWWSRPYEYAWCSTFADPDAVVLDAACGIGHPFKFYLTTLCRDVHACDFDKRIYSATAILDDVREMFGDDAVQTVQQTYLDRVRRLYASITQLPYPTGLFDTVFCVSVLEHLPVHDMVTAVQEFYRVLRPGGKLVLTCDYPNVAPEMLHHVAVHAGFAAVPLQHAPPHDAISSNMWGSMLYCYRVVFTKPSPVL